MSLADNIYQFRTEQNMSQLDLADALEVSRQSVSKWETGAAVPELDKLIKMSDLFHVTLDVLVGRSSPAPAAPTPSTVRSIATMSPQQIVGTILLIFAFLLSVILTLTSGILSGLLLPIPLVMCGIICLVCKRRAGLWCAWALFLPLLLIPLKQYLRSDIAMVLNLFTRIPLLLFTAWSFRKDTLQLTKSVLTFLGVGWITWFFWFVFWLASLRMPPELFDGFSLGYVMEVLTFPLFAALLTTTFRIRKRKEAEK